MNILDTPFGKWAFEGVLSLETRITLENNREVSFQNIIKQTNGDALSWVEEYESEILEKYAAGQPRNAKGQFASGGGGGITLDAEVNDADFWYADSPAGLKEEVATELARDMKDAGVADFEFEQGFQDIYGVAVDKMAEPAWTTPKKASEISVLSVDSDGNPFQRQLDEMIMDSRMIDEFKDGYLQKNLSAAEARDVLTKLNVMEQTGTSNYLGFSEGKDLAVRNAVASGLVRTWAESSNDETVMAHALQAAAKERFGLQDSAEWKSTTRSNFDKEVDYVKTVNANLLQNFVQIQYDNTQTHFANQGITNVVLYRGLRGSVGLATGTGEVSLRPMSSWSTDISVARNFSGDTSSQKGTILRATVNVKDIIATPFTGVGCLEEQEMVIKGGVIKVDYRELGFVASNGGKFD